MRVGACNINVCTSGGIHKSVQTHASQLGPSQCPIPYIIPEIILHKMQKFKVFMEYYGVLQTVHILIYSTSFPTSQTLRLIPQSTVFLLKIRSA